ncbi:MAG: glycosyl hydrolase [Erysipelotrichales bacterium]|nr:MAG: glycosyl hydrolase [Erysipelotrichales bacterium]
MVYHIFRTMTKSNAKFSSEKWRHLMDSNEILKRMTTEEKIRLCSGKDFWHIEDFPQYGIPSIMVTDGPHGLRKQAGDEDMLGLSESVKATAFPTASLSACSWDTGLLYEMGEALGEECVAEKVSVLLGPGVNMKRNPLCGRNFEYFSEDPVLAGELAAAFINGVQSKGVGTSLKHFAANNQELQRMTSSSNIDDRALREYYLLPFEIAVRKSRPWTLMCSYNRINGVYSSANKWLLNDVLRREWGFDGLVMSDWGAGHDHVEDLKAGMDLEMPGNHQYYLKNVMQAIESGKMTLDELDENAARVLKLIEKSIPSFQKETTYDIAKHRRLARKVAANSIVLLKNEEHMLPLPKDAALLIIGELADKARYQGSGSSKINPHQVESLLDGLKLASVPFTYQRGYDVLDGNNIQFISQAVEAIQPAQTVILFIGLTDDYESEGFDRTSLKLPASHDRLVEAVCQKTKNVVVILAGGAVVEMPWVNEVPSLLNGYLPGEAGGPALCDVLFGDVNHSGKLAETYPHGYDQMPSSETYGKERNQVNYRESMFVGYRYFDIAQEKVLFPFGHGLSYTTFEYSDLALWRRNLTFNIKNTGMREGYEIVQFYVSNRSEESYFPLKELRGFQKVFLQPGEEKEITFTLQDRDIQYFHPILKRFVFSDGRHDFLIGSSSRDIRLKLACDFEGEADLPLDVYWGNTWYVKLKGKPTDSDFEIIYKQPVPKDLKIQRGDFTMDSSLYDMRETIAGWLMAFISKRMLMKTAGFTKEDIGGNEFKMMLSFVMTTPLRATMVMSQGALLHSLASAIVSMANGNWIRGISQLLRKKNLR